jgi:hypothetical protein
MRASITNARITGLCNNNLCDSLVSGYQHTHSDRVGESDGNLLPMVHDLKASPASFGVVDICSIFLGAVYKNPPHTLFLPGRFDRNQSSTFHSLFHHHRHSHLRKAIKVPISRNARLQTSGRICTIATPPLATDLSLACFRPSINPDASSGSPPIYTGVSFPVKGQTPAALYLGHLPHRGK